MSGGVDSSTAAYLIRKEGLECIGATMRLYQKPADSTNDVEDARNVAAKLGMPFYVFDLQDTFREKVMDAFVETYEAGLTPNPCVLCNRYLKFDLFLQHARELGCDYIVTGHYARVMEENGRFLLKKAVDTAKDQTYFLYALTQEQLKHTRFPLGDFTKTQARDIAQEQGFINARKRDSQDICFVPDGDYKAFLERHTGKCYPCGDYLDLSGKAVGRHNGAVGYTIGQRKGLGIALGAPVYVCGKDMAKNTVTVGPNEALFRRSLVASDLNWIAIPELREPIRVLAKARSRMAEQPATVFPEANGTVRVEFDEPQRALTTGQAVVFYQGDTVIGGGTITKVL